MPSSHNHSGIPIFRSSESKNWFEKLGVNLVSDWIEGHNFCFKESKCRVSKNPVCLKIRIPLIWIFFQSLVCPITWTGIGSDEYISEFSTYGAKHGIFLDIPFVQLVWNVCDLYLLSYYFFGFLNTFVVPCFLVGNSPKPERNLKNLLLMLIFQNHCRGNNMCNENSLQSSLGEAGVKWQQQRNHNGI